MSFGEAFWVDGNTLDPAAVATDQLANSGAPMPPDYQPGSTVDPADVMTRMLRKVSNERLAKQIADRQNKQAQPSFADFGTQDIHEDPAQQPPKEPEPEQPVGWSDLPGVGVKSFAKGAIEGAAGTVKGLAGVLAHGADSEPSMTMSAEPPPVLPAKDNPVYKAGQSIEDFGNKIPLSSAEQDTLTGRVAGGLGGLAGMAPGMAVGGALGGPPGALAAGGAQMGLGAAASTFDAAIAKGATEEKAAQAAGLSGVLNAAIGSLPLGVILRPLEKVAPGLMGYAASKLAQRAAEGAAAFSTIGEAQEWISGQIQKDFYPADPKHPESGYEWDGKRFTANAITGAIAGLVGGMHGGEPPAARARQGAQPPIDIGQLREVRPGLPPPGAAGEAGIGAGGARGGPGPEPGGPGAAPAEPPSEPRPGPEADTPDQTRRRAAMEGALKDGYGVDPTGMSFTSMAEALRNRDILTRYGLTRQEIQDLGNDENPKFKAALKEAMEAGSHHPSTGPGSPGTRDNPVDASGIDAVNNVMNADPSAAQSDAENYRHIHAEIPELGLAGKNGISVETVRGGTRKGPMQPPDDQAKAKIQANIDTLQQMRKASLNASQDTTHIDEQIAQQKESLKGQPAWTSTMGAHYGRIKGTVGADGQPLDIFTGNTPNAPSVFVLDQKDPKTGKFDETKIFARFSTPFDAINAYLSSHDAAGPTRMGGMRALTPEEFKDWIRSGDTQGPLSDSMKAAANESTVSQARPVENPGVRGVAEPQGQVQQPQQPGGAQLPGAGDQAASGVGGGLPGVPGGGGATSSEVVHPGAGGQQRPLRAGERPLGDQEGTGAQHAQEHQSDVQGPNASDGGVGGGNRPGAVDTTLSPEPGRDDGGRGVDNPKAGRPPTSVTPEQVKEARETLAEAGVPPYPHDHIDVVRALKIASQEGYDFDDAFQLAVVRNRVDDGFLTPEQVHDIYGQEIAAAVDAVGAPQRLVSPETSSPATGGEATAPQPEGGVTRGGEAEPEGHDEGHKVAEGEDRNEPNAAGIEPNTGHGEPDTGGTSTGTEHEPAVSEPESAGGKPAAESNDEAAHAAGPAGADTTEPTGVSEDATHAGDVEPEGAKKKIEDAGEKIGGARKDRWGDAGLDVKDLEAMNPAERIKYTTKENVWPRPDYVQMVERGVEPKAAFLIKRIYDRLATSPNENALQDDRGTPEGTARIGEKYIKAMRVARDAAEKAATVEQVERISDVVSKAHRTQHPSTPGRYSVDREAEESIYIPTKKTWRQRGNPFSISREDLRAAEHAVADGFPNTEAWQRLYRLHEYNPYDYDAKKILPKVWLLQRKGNSEELARFPTKEEAQAGAKAYYEAQKEKGGEAEKPKDPVRPHLDSLERTGPDYRGGRNVDANDFIKDFGFRGVEFGNWVAGDERQKMVNQAYDGLHDLARVLGLPPKAMSLDGSLAMGFGSRGQGGRAAAHYEPALKVFNFTKLSGAGSVAHEWAHALDHYLGTFGGQNQPMTMASGGRGKPAERMPNATPRLAKAFTELAQALFARKESTSQARERLVKEIEQAKSGLASWERALEAYKTYTWGARKKANEMNTARQQIQMRQKRIARNEERLAAGDLNLTMVPTAYHTQASKVSGSDYYTRPEEMFARAFESWVFDKVTKEGNKSDYLVHGVEPTRYAQGYKGNPYPAGEEREAFGKGFDRIFRAIKAVEGKNGIGLEGDRGVEPDQTSISIPTEPAEPAPLDNPNFVKDLDKTGEESATEASGPQQAKPLAQHFLERFRTGEGFQGILQARKFASEAGFPHAAKAVEEALELAVVKRAREVVEQGKTPAETFTDLRYLYGQQPNLGTRTSTSIREQAYSTPVPLAYVASRLADITHKTTVYEPTAGNGALLIEANPNKTYANEINLDRVENLKGQGFAPSKLDASERDTITGLTGDVDRVIANPPFGTVVEGKESKVFDLGKIQENYRTTQVDHAIAIQALEAMKDDGKAVLILGGINKQVTDPKDRSDAYHGKAKREFFKVLYDRYNVVDHVTVDGDLYSRQGASWPVDLVVIDGRGKSARSLPAVDVPRVLHTWDEVGGLLDGQRTGSGTARRPDDTSAVAGPNPTTAGGNGGGRGPVEPGGPSVGPAEPGGPGEIQPGTVPNGEPANAVDEQAALDKARGGSNGHDRAPDAERRPLGLSDLGAFLHSAIDDLYGPDVPPEEQAQEQPKEGTAKPRAKAEGKREPNAAGELSESAKKAFEALGTMFGGKAKLSMGVTIDPEKYEQAKPLFKEAAKHFRNFIDDLREFGSRILAKLREMFEFTKEALEDLVPYIEKFISEVHLGQIKLDDEEPKAKKADRTLDKETTLQVRYTPKSDGTGMGTLVPVNMRENIAASLRGLEKRVGNLDDFVTKELGYGSKEETWEAVGAEQVDALALAIDNMKAGKGFIIGDQTGIGKGRVNAGIIRWAIKNKKIPVFFTKGPDLYADIYRDLVATGIQKFLGAEPRMLMTNGGERVPLDEDGKVVLASQATPQHNQHLNSLDDKNFRDKHDMVFTTYNQINTLKGEETVRRSFLNRIAPNAIMVFDESHNAGGQAVGKQAIGTPNRATFARNLIDNSAHNGTFYSSATYAKRPDVMDLYRATDMRMAATTPQEMEELFKRGGIPMQQVVASMLAEGGQYIRRERSFDGIAYNTPSVEVDKDQYNGFSRALQLIHHFSGARAPAVAAIHEGVKAEGAAVSGDGSTGGAGASSINFTAIMHNIINQMLLSAKAKPAADAAIAAIERGEKPVLTVANTMGSFLADYADNLGIAHGQEMPADFRDVLMKYLDRTRTVTVKKPFMKKGEKAEQHYLTDAELGPAGRAAYEHAKDHIQTLDLSNLSISPIDDIKSRIEAAGYRVGEITGRNDYVDFSGEKPIFMARPGSEKSITGRRKTIGGFNKHPDNGGIHAVVINQAGSTGISMHASEFFEDQRPRRMIIVQPEANIDTHMQMLGRVHRTGQVVVPSYDQLVADIPAEKRPAAVLAKKMASLNANTTASRGSALTAENVPDFMNEVGDMVASAFISENPDINLSLGMPLHLKESGEIDPDGAMRKVTGRIPLLPLHQQEDIYAHLEGEYKALIEQMDAAGENILEAKSLDLQAKTKETTEVMERKKGSNSPFAAPVNIEKAIVRRLGKPMSSVEIANRIMEDLRGGTEVESGATEATAPRILEMMEHQGPQNVGWKEQNNKNFQDALHDFASYKRSIVDEMKDAQKAEEERVKLDAIKNRWTELRQMLLPGKRVTLKTSDGNMTGIVLKAERKGQAKNPLALGTWKATFAVADASRQLTIPFSRLFARDSDPENMTHIDVEPLRYENYSDTLGRFERQQNELHEERYIATGNLLAAFGWLNSKGKIINYTDDKGLVRQGIMTPKTFDLSKFYRAKARTLATPNDVLGQLTKAPHTPVFAKDGFVSVRNGKWGGVLEIYASKAKRDGGVYYLDKDLAALTDTGDFITSGGHMVGKVEQRNAAAAIGRMQELGAVFGAPATEGPKTEKVPDEAPKQPSIMPAAPRTMVPGQEKARSQIEGDLSRMMENMIGKTAEFRFPDEIPATEEDSQQWGDLRNAKTYNAAYIPAQKVIEVAMANPKTAGNERGLRSVARHEVFHHFKNVLANDKEVALMERETPRLRKIVQDHFGLDDKTADSIHPEEIQAIAAEIQMNDAEDGRYTTGIHIGLRPFFDRLRQIFARVRNYMRGLGYNTFKDVVDSLYHGAMKDRAAGEPRIDLGQQPSIKSSRGRMPAPDRLRDRIANVLGSDTAITLKEGLVDYNERLRLFRNDVETMHRNWVNADGELPDAHDFYTLKRLFPGKKGARIDEFDKWHFDPLREWMRKSKLDIDNAGLALNALHAVERNGAISKLYPESHQFSQATKDWDIVGGSGMSNNQATKILRTLKDGPQGHLYPELIRRVAAIRDWIQKEMIKGNLESRERIEQWNETYDHYVPLSGWEDPLEEPEEVRLREMGGKGKRSSGAIAGPEVKTAFGRKTLADNPLVNLIKNAYRTIDRAEKNRVLVSTARAVSALPSAARRELGIRIDHGAPTKIIDPNTGLAREINNPADRFSDRAVPYKVNGATHFMLTDDPRLAEVMKRWSPTQLWGVFRAIQWLQNKWKSTITHYSPKFLARHNARYYVENMLNAMELKETGKYSPSKLAWEAFPVIGEATRAIFAHEAGKGGGRLGNYWGEMKAEGGTTGLRMMRDLDEFKEEMRIKVSTLGAATMNPLRVLRESAEIVNRITSVFDNAQRLAQYAEARDQGMSQQKAALLHGRDATIDYAMRGLWSNMLGIVQPFFGVAIQTGHRMWSAQGRSGVMRKVMLATMATGLALSAWNYLVGGKDEDGIPFFDKVAPWDRAKNMVIMAPWLADEKGRPGVIKLPFPFNWAFPLSSGYTMGNFLWGSETAPQAFIHGILGPFISTFSQVGEEGVGLNTFIPEIMKAPYEIATNKDWKGSKIHITEGQHGPNSESGERRTDDNWKSIARALNYVSGGTRQKSGYFDFYPEDIKTFFDPYIGTHLRLGEEVGTTAGSIMKGEAPDPSQVPIGNVFYGANYDAANAARAGHRRYENSHPWLR